MNPKHVRSMLIRLATHYSTSESRFSSATQLHQNGAVPTGAQTCYSRQKRADAERTKALKCAKRQNLTLPPPWVQRNPLRWRYVLRTLLQFVKLDAGSQVLSNVLYPRHFTRYSVTALRPRPRTRWSSKSSISYSPSLSAGGRNTSVPSD